MTQLKRLLLRAELHAGGTHVVTHTVELSAARVTVACPIPVALHENVRLDVSFPGLVHRIELGCRVIELHGPDGHGRPSSITCAIEEASDDARAQLEALTAPREQATRTYRCLLVEDNRFTRELFAYGVQKYGRARGRPITIDLAEDAEEAWRMLEQEPYDMALVDHYLPSHTGAELIARIRGDARLARMSLVAMSVGGIEVRAATLAAGADLYLDKPVVLRDLFDTLDELAVEEVAP